MHGAMVLPQAKSISRMRLPQSSSKFSLAKIRFEYFATYWGDDLFSMMDFHKNWHHLLRFTIIKWDVTKI